MTSEPLFSALASVVGQAHILTDPELVATYEVDWTGRFRGRALAVVRPGDTAEVSAVLRLCAAARVAVVPQGGNTGLVGGGVPTDGEVVLSSRRLTSLTDLDIAAGEVTAGAGVTLEALNAFVRPHGFEFGIDLASRGSATVGGMAATNAGGVNVLRHGMMRAQIAGMEAVLADGSVVSRLAGVGKDNTGYDIPQLLTGSEGTLAVITRLRLRLVRSRAYRAVALLACDSLGDAIAVALRVRRDLPTLDAAEAFFPEGLDLVCEHAGLRPPFGASYAAYLLLECAADTDPAGGLADALLTAQAIRDSAFATDTAARQRLWAYRERHTEAINAAGVPQKLDVAVPLDRLASFVAAAPGLVRARAAGARTVIFGHLAEGNMHVNILGLAPDDERAADAVLRFVAELGGSISAEHGIGRAKTRWLHLTRSEADVAAMRAIKHALDPLGQLNPGVIFPVREQG